MGAGGIVKTALVWQRETGETDLEKVFRIVLRRRKTMSPHMEAMLTELSGSGSGRQWRTRSPRSFTRRTELIQGLCGLVLPFRLQTDLVFAELIN